MTDEPGMTARRPRGYGVWAAVALAVLLAAAVLYLHKGSDGKPSAAVASPLAATLQGLSTGEMAAFLASPTLSPVPAIAFKDADGKEFSLEAYRGKLVLLNIWATWCVPCRHEMPALDGLKAALGGKDFDVIAIATDRGGLEKPKKFWADAGIKSLVLFQDSSDAQHKLGVIGMPTTLLIDRQGRELGRLIGPAEWASPEAKALLQAAIRS